MTTKGVKRLKKFLEIIESSDKMTINELKNILVKCKVPYPNRIFPQLRKYFDKERGEVKYQKFYKWSGKELNTQDITNMLLTSKKASDSSSHKTRININDLNFEENEIFNVIKICKLNPSIDIELLCKKMAINKKVSDNIVKMNVSLLSDTELYYKVMQKYYNEKNKRIEKKMQKNLG
jgi:hypothetical protein